MLSMGERNVGGKYLPASHFLADSAADSAAAHSHSVKYRGVGMFVIYYLPVVARGVAFVALGVDFVVASAVVHLEELVAENHNSNLGVFFA